MEPWLPLELRTIPKGLGKYLEVGCGQGVDSYFICSNLNNHDDYTAIDFLTKSVLRAVNYMTEAGEVLI